MSALPALQSQVLSARVLVDFEDLLQQNNTCLLVKPISEIQRLSEQDFVGAFVPGCDKGLMSSCYYSSYSRYRLLQLLQQLLFAESSTHLAWIPSLPWHLLRRCCCHSERSSPLDSLEYRSSQHHQQIVFLLNRFLTETNYALPDVWVTPAHRSHLSHRQT